MPGSVPVRLQPAFLPQTGGAIHPPASRPQSATELHHRAVPAQSAHVRLLPRAFATYVTDIRCKRLVRPDEPDRAESAILPASLRAMRGRTERCALSIRSRIRTRPSPATRTDVCFEFARTDLSPPLPFHCRSRPEPESSK